MTTQTLTIGFGHRARSGKDLCAEHLIETYKSQYDIRRYAFGDELKAEFYDVLRNPLHEYWRSIGSLFGNVSYLFLPHPVTYVSFAEKLAWIAEHKNELGNHLQIYATEYIRARDHFYWVRLLRERIDQDKPEVALIPDVRFFNEFYYVKSLGGFMVKVTREGFVLNDGRSANHQSERELESAKFDFEISVSDGAVDELKTDAVSVFETIASSLKPASLENGVADVVVAA